MAGLGLKRCPFCGGSAEIRVIGSTSVVVRCTVCGGSTDAVQAHSTEVAKTLAVDAWNRRVNGGK